MIYLYLIPVYTTIIALQVPKEITTDLLKAEKIGLKCYHNFIEERLTEGATKKFNDPLKTNRLKTFSNMVKKKEVKIDGRSSILKADRSLFARIIVMAQTRDLPMLEVLSHPLGPLPWSLSTPDGQLRKTDKSALALLLQKNVPTAESLSDNFAVVIDGMALVQKISLSDQPTFGDIARLMFNCIICDSRGSLRIDVVFYTYKEISIKNCERSQRTEESSYHQLQNITSTQNVRQWRKFLSVMNNKSSLIDFLVQEWQKPSYVEKLYGRNMFVTCKQKCYKISDSQPVSEIAELISTHEEADGRLLLHAAHASIEGYTSVVIICEDTDVFVCLVAHCKKN